MFFRFVILRLMRFNANNVSFAILQSIKTETMDSVNCTVPFLPPHARKGFDIRTNKTLGKLASHILYTSPMRGMNLWSQASDVIPPCLISTSLISRKGTTTGAVVDNSEMMVTEQFWAYEFMSDIVENGGFVGLSSATLFYTFKRLLME